MPLKWHQVDALGREHTPVWSTVTTNSAPSESQGVTSEGHPKRGVLPPSAIPTLPLHGPMVRGRGGEGLGGEAVEGAGLQHPRRQRRHQRLGGRAPREGGEG